MPPRDNKKSDYIPKENDNTLINNENIHATVKASISTIRADTDMPLKPIENLPGIQHQKETLGKPIIEQAKVLTPSKGWKELASEAEEKNINVDEELTAKEEKVVVQYEEHFPALGAEPEEKEPETEFKTELLQPENIVRAQIHDEQVMNSSMGSHPSYTETEESFSEKMKISREFAKDMVDKIIHHSLDEIPASVETTQPEKIVIKVTETPIIETPIIVTPVIEAPIITTTIVETPIITIDVPANVGEWGQGILPKSLAKKTNEYSEQFPALGEEPVHPEKQVDFDPNVNPELLSPKHIAKLAKEVEKEAPIDPIPYLAHEKVVRDKIVHPIVKNNKPEPLGEWGQGTLPKSMAKKTNEYVAQFPALGEEGTIDPSHQVEFDPEHNPDLLSPKHIAKLAEKVVEEAPANPIPYLAHERTVIKPLEQEKETLKEPVHLNVGEWANGALPKSPRKSNQGDLSDSWGVIKKGSPERSHDGYEPINMTFGEESDSLLKGGKKTVPETQPLLTTPTTFVTPSLEETKLEKHLYTDIEENMFKAKQLEEANMNGAAINILKKNIASLQSYTAKHSNYDQATIDRLFILNNIGLAHLYTLVGEYWVANSFSQAALDRDHHNPRAIFLLGSGLIKIGKLGEGYNVLLESSKIPNLDSTDPYVILIQKELAKVERKVDIQNPDVAPDWKNFNELLPLMGIARDIELNWDKKSDVDINKTAGVMTGAGLVAGMASWFIGKEVSNLSERKGLSYAVGIGALVAGVGGIAYSLFTNNKKSKKL